MAKLFACGSVNSVLDRSSVHQQYRKQKSRVRPETDPIRLECCACHRIADRSMSVCDSNFAVEEPRLGRLHHVQNVVFRVEEIQAGDPFLLRAIIRVEANPADNPIAREIAPGQHAATNLARSRGSSYKGTSATHLEFDHI